MAKRNEQPPRPERVIALLSGDSGTGKSFFIGNLKNALLFDTDIGGGMRYLDARIARNGSERIEVGSYLDVIEALERRRGRMKEITTLAFDHLTSLQQEAVIRWNPQFQENTFGREHDRANKEWRKIRELVRWGGFHLFATSHLKAKYEKKQQIGMVADGAKNIQGDFEIYLHLESRGPDVYPSVAHKIKWRRDPDDPRGKVPASFDFTMERFLQIHGQPLEGEREEVPLASVEQLHELGHLLEVLKVDEDWTAKCWAKAKVEAWSEMPEALIQKAIDFLRGKLPPAPEQLKNPTAA